MQFAAARADVVKAINQRWLLTFWTRHLGNQRIPRWQAVEAENLSRIKDTLSFLDVIADPAGYQFRIAFHGAVVGQVFGAADCRGKLLYQSLPESLRTQKLAAYRHAVDTGHPVYTIQDVTDRSGRPVQYERLLLPFSNDGQTVSRILTSFEFVCEEGAFARDELMATPTSPSRLRLSATIPPQTPG